MKHFVRILAFLLLFLSCFLPLKAQNEIVTENALPGNPASEWDITGAGDLSIQGFADGLSVNKGETVRFKIDVTGPATNYTIKIYRLGYYGGDGARLIVDLGTFAGVAQPAPATDVPTGLIDCGTWSESASWAVPGTAVSGIYIAKLTRTDNNGASHIAFIVRDDGGDSDLLFKTSDGTWQAYNGYGGNSLYVGNTGFPSGHAAKVSYNRPFLTRGGGGGSSADEDWLFNSEYPMLRFLERNGYDVSYTTDLDMERDPNPIDTDHEVILSVGHDEYWSAAERTKFENARNAGVHLAFFSGNEVYWQTRWESSIDGNNDPVRTLVCYKEGTLGENTCGGKCDPNPNVWTGLWRDGCAFTPPANGCNPENALSGQISWQGSTTEIQVPDTYKNLRFWRNTSIASLGIGQTATLTAGSLGYEWDWEQYPESYPHGRILMSSTTSSGRTHKLSLYRHSSGAYVFGAGTVQWAWGLDDVHDRGGSPVDPAMQQATINLLADMGVQPATLMAGMVGATASTDVDAPSSVITTPLDGATFPNASNVTISGTATDAGGGVVAGVEVSVDGGTTWRVATGTSTWTYNWVPTVEATYVIKSRAFDDTGNMEVPGAPPGDDAITVEISGSLPCPCTVFQPADVPATPLLNDGQPLVLGMKFRSNVDGYITKVRFYKDAGNTGTHTGQLWSSAGTLLEQVTFVNETASGWQEETFPTPVAITANTTYVVSYHSSSGFYSITNPYFTNAVFNGPLTGLANGDDGPNGVYKYSATPVFPDDNYQTSNYWVDVVFETEIGPDNTPPTVSSTVPTNGASGVSVAANVTATFSEAIDPLTVDATTVELLDPLNAVVPATISYNVGAKTATIDPTAALDYSTTYTARIIGGGTDPRIKDLAGNALSANYIWTFTTAAPPPPPPTEGFGGPILVVSAAANPFSRYPVEILRAQGFNEFFALDISQVDETVLDDYDVVILGEMTLTGAQVTMFSDWVDDGGTFIALRPDAQLATLLGITSAGGTLSEGYLLVNTASDPGAGIVNQTIQFHGTADQYNLNGATSLATLYSNANTATAYPAVTMREVGANGGKAAAFTYDLARSIIYTRQGNPAWAGQERDGESGPIRSDDLFFGNAAGDPQPDWINLDKVAIPQADEQMHLLSNIIALGNLHRKPLPRLWFLPSGHKAAIVMTGDDHANGGTVARFNQYVALSPSNTPQAVADWVAVRGSSYIYPGTPITDAQALAFENQGFEIGVHLNTGCANWTPASLLSDFNTQLASLAAQLPSISPTSTHRTHCIAWSDWASQPEIEASLGIRLDVNYYYWPSSWVQDRSGMFTGSGMPMRFAELDGSIIDCYQVTTQMPDESGLTFPAFCDDLLDRALGAEGYYGVFCANMHTDANNSPGSDAIIASALARNVPVISAKQMLTWLDGRNGSSFESIAWSSNELSFSINVGAGALNLRGMVPVLSDDGILVSLAKDGNPHPYTTQTIKGVAYAFFSATGGDYVATYEVDDDPPVITNIIATPNTDGTATITWETNELADSRVDYGTAPGSLSSNESNAALVTNHSVTLSGLSAATTYYFRVTSEDGSDNSATSPNPPAAPLSFIMPYGACADDETAEDFALGTADANILLAPDGNGAVMLQSAVNEEFPGPGTPAGWTQGDWTGGTTTYSGGQVMVNGTHIGTNASFAPGTAIEFEATFRAGPFQNVGFSVDFDFNSPWVTIGTGGSGNGVYARFSSGSDVSLGAGLLGSTHRYRIVWNTNNFQFYVDDSPTPAATISFTVGTNMVVQISDYPNDGTALDVNWLRISPFASPGSFTSRVHDAGQVSLWNNASWSENLPAGTTLQIFQRQGNTPTPDGTWTAFTLIPSNGANVGGVSRYIQYRADLATSDPARTPVLRDIEIVCSPPPTPTFEGTIKWHHDGTTGVQNATVSLTGADTDSDMSDVNGDYSLAADVTGNFVITPVKNTNKLNGVTVADATAIQQHIANQVPITNAYRYVGADVNKSNSITTQDATIINQSLLGNPAALAQFKTSWRFSPTSHTMVIPPWGFPEKITLNGVGGGPQLGNNFHGIKTGDIVTAYANPANFGALAWSGLVFNVEDQILGGQKEIVAEFKANQLDDLAAFQFVLRFDSEKLQLAEIQPLSALPLTTDHFGLFKIAEGEIRAVWSQANGAFLEEAAPVFSLKFKVLQGGGKLSEALYLDEAELPAFAYNSVLDESKAELNFYEVTETGEPTEAGLQLLQNRPNPFSGTTAIAFVLPESCEAQLRIFDVSGRMLAERKGQYPAGRNEETFDLEGASGVLYYELTTPFGVLTKKMVAVE